MDPFGGAETAASSNRHERVAAPDMLEVDLDEATLDKEILAAEQDAIAAVEAGKGAAELIRSELESSQETSDDRRDPAQAKKELPVIRRKITIATKDLQRFIAERRNLGLLSFRKRSEVNKRIEQLTSTIDGLEKDQLAKTLRMTDQGPLATEGNIDDDFEIDTTPIADSGDNYTERI